MTEKIQAPIGKKKLAILIFIRFNELGRVTKQLDLSQFSHQKEFGNF